MKYHIALALLLSGQLAYGQLFSITPQSTTESIEIGETLGISVFVTDEREPAEGILSVFLDLDYDPSLLRLVPDSLTFGPSISALSKADTTKPGVIDEAGAFVTGILALPPIPSGIGGEPELLFSVTFEALASGETAITANHADNLPLNAVTLFGIDDGITEAEIAYDSARITIVPEPASRSLLLLAAACLTVVLRKKQQL